MKNYALGQVGDFEIKQLKIFKAVADCGGFSAAETALNISRPTISTNIANLESRLNMTLCKRGRAGFSLTEEGQVLYDQTNQLLEVLDNLRNTINNLGASPSGQLKLATSDAFSLDPRCRMPQIIRHFCRAAPDVELIISVEQMMDMERKVLNDEIDVAIIPYHRPLKGLDYMHLFTDLNYLYCGQDHPFYTLSSEALNDEMISQARLAHAGLKPHQEVYDQLSSLNPSGVSYYYETRIAMLLSGEFIGFLPEAVAAPYVANSTLKKIAAETRSFSLGGAVISKKSSQPNRAKDLLLQTIGTIFSDIDLDNMAPY
ncbi:LysR family transcriptional regulator [Marinobacterium jannaschii]|uniref:LysR family transcriptional regulator n=1 Tax=Marinobacterium jannaschii TaxID=64970 RepID=UPI000483197F|nr:LysR family transcriptional regulator [Marinobacterium jannaschii]